MCQQLCYQLTGMMLMWIDYKTHEILCLTCWIFHKILNIELLISSAMPVKHNSIKSHIGIGKTRKHQQQEWPELALYFI